MKKFKVGYTTGVYDLFHIGHLRCFIDAKELCEKLIVGVSTDELVLDYKHRLPVIPFEERFEIIKSIKYVDEVVPQTTRNKIEAHKILGFDMMYVESTFRYDDIFVKAEEYLKQQGASVIYFERKTAESKSTSVLKEILLKLPNE